jgi:acyl-CoA dehydrogenase
LTRKPNASNLKAHKATMTYAPPLAEILLSMQVAGYLDSSIYADLPHADAQMILDEAARFAADRIAPLNWVGDQNPARMENGQVITPPGWVETYRDWCAGGWNGLTGTQQFEGQGLPILLSAACTELWNAACISFALCPLLTTGAIEAITAHAAPELQNHYLPKLITGEWSGTMNLTEPQSGSDLSQLRCKAKRHSDGTYRITGNKIYITYGDHNLTSNIVHLVLARLEDAPSGTKGISLFLVPKLLPDGTPNDLRCHSLEHKLGIHGSPTCAMVYGDKGGAQAWLIGEENRGLNCMFTMMNNARLLVAVQGVALASRATQAAFAFAAERRQGRDAKGDTPAPIINHPDVKRMLCEMRAKTAASRMLCMATAHAIDESARAASDAIKQQAAARAAFLTPLAKTYATDCAVEVASLAIQVHGGMGFVEETGVAQYYRDARILPIYEGTNGIQAIDLVTRKLTLEDGRTLADLASAAKQKFKWVLSEDNASALSQDVQQLLQNFKNLQGEEALAAATPLTRALAVFIAAGYLAEAAHSARGSALQNQTQSDAHFLLTVELPTAIAAAKASVAAASFVVKVV